MFGRLGQKGQIVIEQAIRETLGLEPGYVAVQKLVGDHVEIYFYPPEQPNSVRGLLADQSKRTVSSEEWALARENAWAEASSQQISTIDAEEESIVEWIE